MHKAGMINSRGALEDSGDNPAVSGPGSSGAEFVVVSAEENHGSEITFRSQRCQRNPTRQRRYADRRNILLQKAGVTEQEIEAVFIAGAFGTYLGCAKWNRYRHVPAPGKRNALFRWVMRPGRGPGWHCCRPENETGCVRCPPGDFT